MKFVVMCAAFALGGLSTGAGPVARIGETDYATLDEAVASGGKIRLLSDVALDSLLVPSGAEVALDLAGHSLTGTQQDQAAVVVHGSLTVDDSVGGGRITHEGAVVIAKKMTSYASAIYNDGEFSLLDGVICDCVSEDSTVWNAGNRHVGGGLCRSEGGAGGCRFAADEGRRDKAVSADQHHIAGGNPDGRTLLLDRGMQRSRRRMAADRVPDGHGQCAYLLSVRL